MRLARKLSRAWPWGEVTGPTTVTVPVVLGDSCMLELAAPRAALRPDFFFLSHLTDEMSLPLYLGVEGMGIQLSAIWANYNFGNYLLIDII